MVSLFAMHDDIAGPKTLARNTVAMASSTFPTMLSLDVVSGLFGCLDSGYHKTGCKDAGCGYHRETALKFHGSSSGWLLTS